MARGGGVAVVGSSFRPPIVERGHVRTYTRRFMRDFLARPPSKLLHRLCGRGSEADRLQSRAPPRVPAQGATVPRRVRNNARPIQFRVRSAADRHGDRVQPRRRRVSARDEQSGSVGIDRRPGLSNRIGRLQHRIQRSTPATARPRRAGAGGRCAGQPQRRGSQGQRGRRAHRDDRHPADAYAGTPVGPLDERVDPLSGAQRLDLHRARRGHLDRHRRTRTAEPADGVDRAGIGVHQHAASPSGLPRRVREELERRAGAGGSAAGTGRQFAVLLRAPVVGRDPHRAVHAGHRHPPRRAQDPGCAPSGVVRRTVDHLDLRLVRGERPLLPVAAAGAVG